MVLAPLDEKALRQPVSNAVRAGIPVVIFDSRLDSDEPSSFVATDNSRPAGSPASTWRGAGRQGQRHHDAAARGLRQHDGARAGLPRRHRDVPGHHGRQRQPVRGRVHRRRLHASARTCSPSNKAADGNVHGIFTPNESTTFGMLRVLENAGLAGKIRFVGFDSSDKLVQGLRAGAIDGLVLQNPFEMGYIGVKTLVNYMRGEQVEKLIDTGVAVVTSENMDQPEIKNRLQPELDEYLK